MERDDKRTINWLVRWLSVIWLAGTSLGALRLFAAIFEKYPILGSLLSCGWVMLLSLLSAMYLTKQGMRAVMQKEPIRILKQKTEHR